MIIVTAKINPDLDGYACSFAYAEFLNKQGKKAKGLSLGEAQTEVSFLNKEFGLKKLFCKESLLAKASQIVLVDMSELRGLPENTDANKVIEVIDHRDAPSASNVFLQAKIQIEKVGAAATLIAEKFKESKIAISKQAAILLYGAIASNTLNFKSQLTTQRDKDMFVWLKKQHNIPDGLIEKMFIFESQFDEVSFRKAILADFKDFETNNNKRVGIAQLQAYRIRDILEKYKKQLFAIFDMLKQEKELDYIFMSGLDLQEGASYLFVKEKSSKEMLLEVFGLKISEKEDIIKLENMMLRKEMMSLIREGL